MRKKLTTKEFIEKARKIHGDKYNYSKVEYVKTNEKVVIICKIHNNFEQKPHAHLQGQGCHLCANSLNKIRKTKTTEEFIDEAIRVYGDKYDYSEVDYKCGEDEVVIGCKKHGKFSQRAATHLTGKGCRRCGIEKRALSRALTKEEFIKKAKKIHEDKYNYDKINSYKNNTTKMKIVCDKHGSFIQAAGVHLNGNGCPHCVLKNEGKVKNLLLKYFKEWNIIPNKKIWNKYKSYKYKRFCDFYMEKDDKKVIVEYDGRQHFMQVSFGCKDKKEVESNFKHIQLKDKLDKQFCREKNIILHRIKYDEDKEKSIKKLMSKVG